MLRQPQPRYKGSYVFVSRIHIENEFANHFVERGLDILKQNSTGSASGAGQDLYRPDSMRGKDTRPMPAYRGLVIIDGVANARDCAGT